MGTNRQELVDGFGFRLRRDGLSRGTATKYLQVTREFLAWLPVDDDPAQVRRSDVERYLDWYAATTGAKPASLRNRICGLQSFYDYLESLELVAANPVSKVKRPARTRKAIDYLSPEEDRAIQSAPTNAQEAILIALLRWTGMRISEACAPHPRATARGRLRRARAQGYAGDL